MFHEGQRLTDDIEVSAGEEVTIEIMSVWTDSEDNENYYIVKCREMGEKIGRYWLDDVDMVSEWHLHKYWELVKE